MKYKISGTKKIPKGKAATYGYKPYVTKSVDEFMQLINSTAIIPCKVKNGHRDSSNIEGIYNWVRVDCDAEGEAKAYKKAFKKAGYEFFMKPSTSNDKNPHKWHFLIRTKGVSQNYDAYKMQVQHFYDNELPIPVSDKSQTSPVQNMNPYKNGKDVKEGVKRTKHYKGKAYEMLSAKTCEKMISERKDRIANMKKKHSDISKDEVKKALKKLDPDMDYESWLRVGMALYDWCPKRGLKLYDKWSKKSDKYTKGVCDDKWSNFDKSLKGDVTIGTLLHMAHGEKAEEAEKAFGDKDKGSVFPGTGLKKPKKLKKKDIKKLEKEKKKIEAGLEYNPEDFPESIRGWMQNSAKAMNLNFSATVPYTMMMASQMLGGNVKIKMTDTWTHAPILWGLNIAGAGVGKSPLIKKLSKPIWGAQMKEKKKHDEKVKEWRAEVARVRADIKKGIMSETDLPDAPKLKMTIMDEFTLEALYDQLDNNPNGVMVWKDELKSLFIQNEKTDLTRSKLISAWSGQSITRNTKTQGSNILKEPYVRVGGNVQPEVVKKILQDNKSGFNADGFIARFQLIAQLRKIKGARWSMKSDYDPFAEELYTKAFEKLKKDKKLKKGKGDKKAKMLTFNPEGAGMVEDYMNNIETMIEDSIDDFQKEFLSKVGSLVGSMITILHELTEKPKETVISIDTITKAISITNTAINNANHLYVMEQREKVENDTAFAKIEAYLKKHPIPKKGKGAGLIAKSIRGITTKQVVNYAEKSKKYKTVPRNGGITVLRM